MNNTPTHPQLAVFMLWVAAAIVAVLLYSRGLPGEFVFDDNQNISNNPYVAIEDLRFNSLQQAWNASSAEFPHNRPLAFLTFGLHHALNGSMDPGHFKIVNILIHITSGLLVLLFLQRLLAAASLSGVFCIDQLKQAQIACAASILWMLHPIQLTSVLYAVQRMTSLSGLFVLLALVSYTGMRLRQLQGKKAQSIRTLVIVVSAITLGALTKQNALLTPIFILIIEGTLLRARSATNQIGKGLLAGLLALVGLIIVVGIYIMTTKLDMLLDGYSFREFTAIERLLTEGRILWMYVYQLLLPIPSSFGLFHDDITISTSLFAPPQTFLAVGAWVGLLAFILWFPSRYPILSFGVLFYLGGHAMESTIFPLELAHEHRNYIPSIGPILLLVALLVHSFQRPPWQQIMRWTALAWIIVAATSTGLRALIWSDQSSLYQSAVNHHPTSARANFLAGAFITSDIPIGVSKNDPQYLTARHYFIRATIHSKHNINGILGLIFLQLHAGQPVSEALFNHALKRLRNVRYSPEGFSLAQFKFLAKWQATPGLPKLTQEQARELFQSALANPTIIGPPKAIITNNYRDFLLHSIGDAKAALEQAKIALSIWHGNLRYFEYVLELELALSTPKAAEHTLHQLEQAAKENKAPVLGLKLVTKWKQRITEKRATYDQY